ncbi:MAG: hypothetical protein DMD79_26680 [Candidatus Rokuibacteriota bacterium]|nr:MAG: hypothetical protein DMD79_26680 [Candidatus Rokubacteria bacterium]
MTLGGVANRQIDPSVGWDDLAWFRSLWSGPLLVKGVLSVADARRAVEHGVDGLIVSNHGGRQLDGAPASLTVLPEIAEAVGAHVEVLLDGGVRRGADVPDPEGSDRRDAGPGRRPARRRPRPLDPARLTPSARFRGRRVPGRAGSAAAPRHAPSLRKPSVASTRRSTMPGSVAE